MKFGTECPGNDCLRIDGFICGPDSCGIADGRAEFLCADLARPTLTQALALPEVKALVEALEAKTVMDPNNSNSTWLDAQARAALAALSTPPADGDKA